MKIILYINSNSFFISTLVLLYILCYIVAETITPVIAVYNILNFLAIWECFHSTSRVSTQSIVIYIAIYKDCVNLLWYDDIKCSLIKYLLNLYRGLPNVTPIGYGVTQVSFDKLLLYFCGNIECCVKSKW